MPIADSSRRGGHALVDRVSPYLRVLSIRRYVFKILLIAHR